MDLQYQPNGNLVPGIFKITWPDFVKEFGYSEHRDELMQGLQLAMQHLKSVGCSQIWIDGSFVTRKHAPGDFDACWDHQGVDLIMLQRNYPVFFDFTNERAAQKAIYKGELMPAIAPASLNPITSYLNFFQSDKEDNPKGIICLIL